MFWNSVRDFILLSLILAGINFLMDKADPGWTKLNPTPWLVPAVLVGARYGFAAGVFSGLATPAIILFWMMAVNHTQANETLHAYSYFFASLAIAGTLAGEIGSLAKKRAAKLYFKTDSLSDENTRLRGELELVLETRHALQRELATFNAPLCALDDELKMLFSYSQEEFADQLLRSLHRLTGITSAGIYVVKKDQLERIAVVHPTPQLAEHLVLSQTPLAEKAASSGELARVPDATRLNTQQPFLAAFPWMDHLGRTAVLLIHDMPLEDYTLNNLARLELILGWASAMAVLRKTFTGGVANDHTVSQEDFMVLIKEALDAEHTHGLPSAVLRFDLPDSAALRKVLKQLPATAVATPLKKENTLVMLLPFSGETEANELSRHLAATVPGLKGHHYLITGPIAPEALWEHVMAP
jgi:GAF domain